MREVVACLLVRDGEIALFRRSPRVASDRGLWQCITGYLEPGNTAIDQAYTELQEEAGLDSHACQLVASVEPLTLHYGGETWRIHPFLFHPAVDTFALNWEHTEFKWAKVDEPAVSGCVWWLQFVLTCSGFPTCRDDEPTCDAQTRSS